MLYFRDRCACRPAEPVYVRSILPVIFERVERVIQHQLCLNSNKYLSSYQYGYSSVLFWIHLKRCYSSGLIPFRIAPDFVRASQSVCLPCVRHCDRRAPFTYWGAAKKVFRISSVNDHRSETRVVAFIWMRRILCVLDICKLMSCVSPGSGQRSK